MNINLIIGVFLALVSVVVGNKQNCTKLNEWKEFKREFNKKYASYEEENVRCDLWYKVYNDVQQHNADKSQTYTKAVYHFADRTSEEHQKLRLGFKAGAYLLEDIAESREFPVGALPASVDWKAKGAVTPVKDQGDCGSCWTFSITGVMEGAYKIAKGTLFSFSEQQLVDCNTKDNYGCSGGFPDLALKYVNQTGGLQLEKDYSYKGVQASSCKYVASKAKVVKIKSIVKVSESDVQIKTALTKGPLSVCVCAGEYDFMYYNSGVYDGVNCSWSNVNHAVLAVGYVNSSKSCYYVIKNSWGATWGANGYINMACNTAKKVQVMNNYYPVLA